MNRFPCPGYCPPVIADLPQLRMARGTAPRPRPRLRPGLPLSSSYIYMRIRVHARASWHCGVYTTCTSAVHVRLSKIIEPSAEPLVLLRRPPGPLFFGDLCAHARADPDELGVPPDRSGVSANFARKDPELALACPYNKYGHLYR